MSDTDKQTNKKEPVFMRNVTGIITAPRKNGDFRPSKILAYCETCERISELTLPTSNVTSLLVEENSIKSKCPYRDCNGMATALPGMYHERNGLLQLLAGSNLTSNKVAQLKELGHKAKNSNYSKEEFLKEATGISPLLSSLGKYIPSEKASVFFGVLVALLAWLFPKDQTTPNVNITNNIYIGDTIKKKSSNYTPPKKKRKKK